MPHIVREFLHFLEQRNITTVHALEHGDIKAYHDHVSKRGNQRRGGGLSGKYILMQMQGVEKFFEYLHHRGVHNLPSAHVISGKYLRKEITVLTPVEIRLLFTTTYKDALDSASHHYQRYNEAMQASNRALLVIYYSCGLRRNEGVNVSIDDINFDTRILHVKKGKNYKERFVPLNKTNADYLQQYIYDYRPLLVKDRKESRLFISTGGRLTSGGTLLLRLQRLQQLTEDISLQEKTIGLHTLRHSIATHLLQAGMSLERIAQFLGHSSLESTQIYTHLIKQDEQQL